MRGELQEGYFYATRCHLSLFPSTKMGGWRAKAHKNADFVLGKVSSALTCSCDALVWGMELLVRSGNLGLRAFEFVAGGNLGVRAFEFVAGAVLGYLA